MTIVNGKLTHVVNRGLIVRGVRGGPDMAKKKAKKGTKKKK